MPKQSVRIRFPLGGRVDRHAYAEQPQGTTVSALNVWPDAQGRERGGSRPGFTRTYTNTVGGPIKGMATLNFIPNSSSRITSRLCWVDDDGDLYIADAMSGPLDQVTNTQPLSTGATIEQIQMTERNQKLYIACHSIVQSESSSSAILYEYDPVAATVVASVATAGSIPRGCPCICTWRDRIVLAGGTTNPYGLFMSRQGFPMDWDYSKNDVGAAVDLGLANAGQIGETVTSLTPHADNCLLIGCPSSLWILQGDPRMGGQLACLSRTIGVVGRQAWCTTPDGLFVFLSHDGLYMIPAGCSVDGNPVSISRERLPVELININANSSTGGKYVSMAYDTRWRGIHIFVTDRASVATDAGNYHWFFDWERKSFWPVQFQEARMDVITCHSRPNYPHGESIAMCGCLDGYVRTYVSTVVKDDEGFNTLGDSTERQINSHVVIGPFADDPEMASDIRVDELDVVLSNATGAVTWELYGGNSAEDAIDAVEDGEPIISGVLAAGRNLRCFPRLRGAAVFLKISSVAVWAYEAATVLLSKLGRTRV